MIENSPLLDVRSPAEFEQGHIPGALNLPLFENDERTRVGTLYKKEGHDAAVLEGLRIVGPKMAALVEKALLIAPARTVRVHCWRGGMRSGSVGWLLRQAGFSVDVLPGGYKTYRQQVLQDLAVKRNYHILGGPTGSGKTYVLHALHALGEHVIDLEGLAHHKGSAFGALGEEAQPSIEQFENNLHANLQTMNGSERIWLEDESRKIGAVFIQDHLWKQMLTAPLLRIELPLNERLDFLVREYGQFGKEALAASVMKIGKRLGGQHVNACMEALDAGDLYSVAKITLGYYDKSYLYCQDKRLPDLISTVACDRLDATEIAHKILQFMKQHQTPTA
jgi:tRNA 2-selenouridine synthase